MPYLLAGSSRIEQEDCTATSELAVDICWGQAYLPLYSFLYNDRSGTAVQVGVGSGHSLD
jgi:hypothetical protein